MQLNSSSTLLKVGIQLILQALAKMRLPGEHSRKCTLQAIEILAQSMYFKSTIYVPHLSG